MVAPAGPLRIPCLEHSFIDNLPILIKGPLAFVEPFDKVPFVQNAAVPGVERSGSFIQPLCKASLILYAAIAEIKRPLAVKLIAAEIPFVPETALFIVEFPVSLIDLHLESPLIPGIYVVVVQFSETVDAAGLKCSLKEDLAAGAVCESHLSRVGRNVHRVDGHGPCEKA